MCIYFWYFPMKLWQWRPGQILPDLQVIKRAISIPWSANVELTFSNNLNYGPCCHVNSVLCTYVFSLHIFRLFSARVARLLFIFIAFHLISLLAKKSSTLLYRYVFHIHTYVYVLLMNNKFNWFSCRSIILFAFFVTWCVRVERQIN